MPAGFEHKKRCKFLSATYSGESAETAQFIDKLINTCDAELSGDYYFIGESVVNYEMESTFDDEMLLITLILVTGIVSNPYTNTSHSTSGWEVFSTLKIEKVPRI